MESEVAFLPEAITTTGVAVLTSFLQLLPPVHFMQKWMLSIVSSEFTRKVGRVYKERKLRKMFHSITLLVIRTDSTGTYLRNSKPCSHCIRTIQSLGIHKIAYSDSDGNVISTKMKDISLHDFEYSSGYQIMRK